jgi:cytochrome c1
VNKILQNEGISKDIYLAEDLLTYLKKVKESSLNDREKMRNYLL